MKTTRANSSFSNSMTSKHGQLGSVLADTGAALCSFLLAGIFTASSAHAQMNPNQLQQEHPGWVQVPGQLIRPECIHEIPNGATVEIQNGQITGDVRMSGQVIAHYEPCAEDAIKTSHPPQSENNANTPSTGNGAVEASLWDTGLKSGDDIDNMSGNITVPSKPSKNGALIYLSNGVEDSGLAWVEEPVLQYGNNGSFGGNYWTMASWLIGPNYVFNSPGEEVYAGDSLYFYSVINTESNGTYYWIVEAEDLTTGAYSYITDFTTGLHWTRAIAGALEAYGLTSCSEFPAGGKAVFTNSTVDHDFPSLTKLTPTGWYGVTYSYGGPSCGFSVTPGTKSTLHF